MKNETYHKIITGVTGAVIAFCAISGVASYAKTNYYEPKIAYEQAEKPEDQTFEPYEHVFYRRFELLDHDEYTGNISGGQVEIPEGYEILEIENYTEEKTRGSYTKGFDVWYINTEPVIAEATYNPNTQRYEYSTPGEVIQNETEIARQKINK